MARIFPFPVDALHPLARRLSVDAFALAEMVLRAPFQSSDLDRAAIEVLGYSRDWGHMALCKKLRDADRRAATGAADTPRQAVLYRLWIVSAGIAVTCAVALLAARVLSVLV